MQQMVLILTMKHTLHLRSSVRFYSAPSPEAKAFVKVGDRVKAGQTVCILEAMKLMNEIESDFDCEIEAVLVSNEQKIEYGQPLFKVKKIED